MKIAGADICKDSAVIFVLSNLPRNLKSFWNERENRSQALKLNNNAEGVAQLLELKVDAIALEPTGVHYAKIWVEIAKANGIEVFWVGHAEVKHYRKAHRLPDKNDTADALILAAYALEFSSRPEHFLKLPEGDLAKIRDTVLQLKTLARIQSPVINRIRQQLAHEFPEAALMQTSKGRDGLYPLWAWIGKAERKVKNRNTYDKLWDNSIAKKYGLSIGKYSQKLAQTLNQIHHWEHELEVELERLLNQAEFEPYTKVFRDFGFGLRTQGLFLTQIYPLDRFTTLGGFKRRMGLGREEDSSGDNLRTKKGGSKICRSTWYLWCLDRIAPLKKRPENQYGEIIGDYYDRKKAQFDNPEIYQAKILEAQTKELKRKIQELIDGEKAKELEPVIELLIKTSPRPQKNQTNKRKMGNLVIGQTCGYSCKILFKALKKELRLRGEQEN